MNPTFLRRHGELQCLRQEPFDGSHDLTCFPLAADHADQKIVGIAAVAEPSEVGVHGIDGRHLPSFLVYGLDLRQSGVDLGLIRTFGAEPVNFAAEAKDTPLQRHVARKWASLAAFIEARFHRLHEPD